MSPGISTGGELLVQISASLRALDTVRATCAECLKALVRLVEYVGQVV